MNVKLAKLFVAKGYLSLDNLKTAVEEQKSNNRSLGEILITRGYITESQLVELTNVDNQFSSVDLTNIDISEDVIKSIPKDTALENNLIPFGLQDSFLNVAMIDPTNLVLIDELRFLTGYNIKPYIAEFSNIKKAITKYYNIPYEEVVKTQQPEQKQQEKQEDVQQEPPQQESVGTAEQPAQQPPNQFQSTNQAGFESSAEPNEEVSQQFNPQTEPQTDDTQQSEEQISTPNEITDVFAKNSDSISQSEQTPQSGFDNVSPQSPESSDNMFAPPPQQATGISEQVLESKDDTSQQPPQNIFQSPAQSSEPADFQLPDSTQDVSNNEADAPTVSDMNVFSSGNVNKSAEDVEDKTIDLSIEAEELLDEETAESKEVTDVFSIPSEQNEQTAQSSASSPPTEPAQSSVDTSGVDDLFKIPGQESSAENIEQSLESESDLRSINEDASHDNIESFNKTIDNNGNQAGISDIGATVNDMSGLESVQSDNIADNEQPAKQESVFPLREEIADQSESVSKPTVLVVDDSPTVQKIVSVTLSRQGYKVEVSSNAMQALAKLNDVIPDIILLDINLPHMDGYQLCKIIKGNELTKEVPVVMLSGKDGFFDKMRGKMVGATDYITKPFEPNTLVSAIKKQGISASSGVM